MRKPGSKYYRRKLGRLIRQNKRIPLRLVDFADMDNIWRDGRDDCKLVWRFQYRFDCMSQCFTPPPYCLAGKKGRERRTLYFENYVTIGVVEEIEKDCVRAFFEGEIN